jgi:hypothetical protein
MRADIEEVLARCGSLDHHGGMLQALEAPVLKLAAVAGAALAVSALIPHHSTKASVQRPHHLTLHAPVNPNATYWTVFDNGPVDLMLPEGPFQIEVTGHYIDGCDWKGIETFMPIDAHRYSYSYDEELLSCGPDGDASHTLRTPRVGYVTVDE